MIGLKNAHVCHIDNNTDTADVLCFSIFRMNILRFKKLIQGHNVLSSTGNSVQDLHFSLRFYLQNVHHYYNTAPTGIHCSQLEPPLSPTSVRPKAGHMDPSSSNNETAIIGHDIQHNQPTQPISYSSFERFVLCSHQGILIRQRIILNILL